MAPEADAAYREVTAGMAARPISTLNGRNEKPPEAIVDEVVNPPAEPASAESQSGSPGWWIAGGLVALALAAGVLVVARRRRARHRAPPGPKQPAEREALPRWSISVAMRRL